MIAATRAGHAEHTDTHLPFDTTHDTSYVRNF